MLKTRLLHPQILEALAASGHFSQVLIADGNFPAATCSNPLTKKVFLNLTAGIPDCMQVLDALLETIPVQEATVMTPPREFNAKIQMEYRKKLGEQVIWTSLARQDFYDKIKSSDTSLLIVTGEQRRFANLLLTIGVVKLTTEDF